MTPTMTRRGGQIPLREELIELIEEWRTSADRESKGHEPCYFTLSKYLDDFLVQARNEHRNPRVELLPEHSDAGDLLELSGEKIPQLDELREELKEKSQLEEKPATVATALVAGHCARLDSNPQAAESVWKWVDTHSSLGWTPSEIPVLRVIDLFAKTSSSSEEWPTLMNLKDVAKDSLDELELGSSPQDGREELQEKKIELHRPILTHLTEVLSALPNNTLKDSTDLREWVEEIHEDYFAGAPFAPFHQHYARILLRLGDLDEARKQADKALAHSKPHMLQSIESSRQMRLAIDLEDMSRGAIAKEVTEKVEGNLHKNSEELQEKLSSKIKETAKEERAGTSSEIQDALLRIVEVLGVFLAVVGVAVTAVGGIAVEGSVGVRIAVWGCGYGSIVSLFWLLRRIVGRPGLGDTLRERRDPTQ